MVRLHKGLGLVATDKRQILSGNSYEPLFPKPQATDPLLTQKGEVEDTVQYCIKIVKATLKDTQLIAPMLKKVTLDETCRAIFDFFYKHYNYQIDSPTVEQLRRPARAWKDRKQGIDCDCFSISVSSVLTNLGIPHSFRITKYDGKSYFQHIYVVVPKFKDANLNIRNNYHVIDPVLNKYDVEAPGITEKKDTAMSLEGMPIQYLNGVNGSRLGREYDNLGDGLGSTDVDALYGQFCKCTKQHLINTRNTIAASPAKVSKMYDVKGLLGAYDELIGAWDNEAKREAVLEKLSGSEELLLNSNLQGLGDLIHGNDDELFGVITAELTGLSGLDGKKQEVRKQVIKKQEKKVNDAGKKVATKTASKIAPIKKGTKGTFTNIKNANKIVKPMVKKAGAQAKVVAKKVGKQIVKNNPVTLSARAGMLMAMKTNFGKIASRAIWGVRSAEEARAAGVTESYRQKSIKAYQKILHTFVDTLKGQEAALKKAIITGRASKVSKKLASKGALKGTDGLNGLGVVTEASITSALAFITPILAFMNSIFKTPSGKEETETGGVTALTSDDPYKVSPEIEPSTISAKDTVAIERTYKKQVEDAPIESSNEAEGTAAPAARSAASSSNSQSDYVDYGGKPDPEKARKYKEEQDAAYKAEEEALDAKNRNSSYYKDSNGIEWSYGKQIEKTPPTKDAVDQPETNGKTGLFVVGGLALAGIGIAMAKASSNKKKQAPVNGPAKKVKSIKLK